MKIVDYNVKVPEKNDPANVWTKALEENWELRFAPHNHDGVNSEAISLANVTRDTQSIDNADWVPVSQGFQQVVNLPGANTLANTDMKFRVTSGALINRTIYPTIEPVSLTQFNLIVNDSTLDLEILYL